MVDPDNVVSGAVEDVVAEENNNATVVRALSGVIIGEPSSPDYDINEAVVYSHNYFEKSKDGLSAVCLTCQLSNSKLAPRFIKKESYSIQGSSTSGNY